MIDSLAGVLILAGGLSTRMGRPKALLTLPTGETLLDYHVRHASQLAVPILIADNEQGFTSTVDVAPQQVIHIADYQPKSSHPKAQLKHSAGPLGAISAGLQYLMPTSIPTSMPVPVPMPMSDNVNAASWLLVVSCDSLISALDIWQYLQADLKNTEKTEKTLPSIHRPLNDSLNDSLNESLSDSLNDPLADCVSDSVNRPKVFALSDGQRMYPLLGLYNLAITDALTSYLDKGERRVMGFIHPICHPVVMPESWYVLSNLNTPDSFEQACQYLVRDKSK